MQSVGWLGLASALVGLNVALWADSSDPAAGPKPAEEIRAKAPPDPRVTDDWKQLAGRWERVQSLPDGTELRLEKVIADQHEVLRVYAADGTLMREQQADLAIERRGNLRVLAWRNAIVTAGAGKGSQIADGTAVITFRDGKYICVCGLAADEDWSVYAETWTRIADDVGKA